MFSQTVFTALHHTNLKNIIIIHIFIYLFVNLDFMFTFFILRILLFIWCLFFYLMFSQTAFTALHQTNPKNIIIGWKCIFVYSFFFFYNFMSIFVYSMRTFVPLLFICLFIKNIIITWKCIFVYSFVYCNLMSIFVYSMATFVHLMFICLFDVLSNSLHCTTSHQAQQARKPRSYASLKLRPLTHSLTGVRCRATSAL